MSFLKNITDMLKSGKVPNLDAVTKLASDSLGGKEDSPFAKKEITDDMLTPMQLQISRMQWDWRDATQSENKGSGNAVNNWDHPERNKGAQEDIYLTWAAPAEAVTEYLLVLAWKGWATALIQRDSRKFIPEYIDAMFSDSFSTVRIVKVEAPLTSLNAIRFAAGENNTFYHLKLIGKTASGSYVEIKDYCLASQARREKNNLPAIPSGDIATVAIPAGSREPNAAEKPFQRQ